MALLNPPEILPALIRVIVEATVMYAKPVNDDRLIELLSPGAPDRPGSIGRADKPHVVNSHAAARLLGLLETVDGMSVPSAASCEGISHGSLRTRWPEMLWRAVVGHESVSSAVKDCVAGDTTGVRDLAFALTWFLAQDSLGPPLTWESASGYESFQGLQQRQVGPISTVHPVQNDTRFGAFERWSLHMGFAVADELGERALRPAPISVVRDVVTHMEPGLYELDEFCIKLGEAVPCLWRGFLRDQLVEFLGEDPDPDVARGGIDSSVALALVTLEAEALLRLKPMADAPRRGVLAPRSLQPRSVTHVEVLT